MLRIASKYCVFAAPTELLLRNKPSATPKAPHPAAPSLSKLSSVHCEVMRKHCFAMHRPSGEVLRSNTVGFAQYISFAYVLDSRVWKSLLRKLASLRDAASRNLRKLTGFARWLCCAQRTGADCFAGLKGILIVNSAFTNLPTVAKAETKS